MSQDFGSLDLRSGISLISSQHFGSPVLKNDNLLYLFADGKQGAWYDPSDKSTLFQDVAGTVSVTKDGDPVALMRDKSGNGNHATQGISSARPIYRTDGTYHWLAYDGVDDHFDAPQLIKSANFSVFAAIKGDSLTHDARYLVQGTGSPTRLFFYSNRTSGNIRSMLGVGRNYYSTSPTADSDAHVYTTIRNASGVLKQRFDGVEKITTGIKIDFENTPATIGGIYNLGMLNGRIYGMIVLSDTEAPVDNIDAVEAYLTQKSGAIL